MVAFNLAHKTGFKDTAMLHITAAVSPLTDPNFCLKFFQKKYWEGTFQMQISSKMQHQAL